VTPAVLGIDWQVLADATGLGAIYALMAVGIGLVFGVLRLVNFAYGQLIMAGAYALALASQWGWPVWAGRSCCRAWRCSGSARSARSPPRSPRSTAR
jgi:branched-subunit amino acid ABC-type transport system permease component